MYDGQEVLFNTITRKILPANASEDELVKNCFLKGMESHAIDIFLSRKMPKVGLTIIPTWECNLRCTHCTVLKRLVKKDFRVINYEKIAKFLKKYVDLYSESKKAHVDFVGGEPLLSAASILEYMKSFENLNINTTYSITTNLSVDLSLDIIALLNKVDYITISLDGTEISHNEQRKSIDGSESYFKILQNIKEIVKLGMANKISVQSALQDKWITLEHRREYYRQLMVLGIQYKKIMFGCVHPTDHAEEPTLTYRQILSGGKIRNNICCKFRNNQMVLDGEKLYSDYYSWQLLGTIDECDSIFENRINSVKTTLSVLKDNTCMSCPVLGCCWGGCVNAKEAFIKPSNYCNQQKLIDMVDFCAKDNSLIEKLEIKK